MPVPVPNQICVYAPSVFPSFSFPRSLSVCEHGSLCVGEDWKRDNMLTREMRQRDSVPPVTPSPAQQLIMYMGMGIYKYKIQLIIRILLHYRLFILKSASFDIRTFCVVCTVHIHSNTNRCSAASTHDAMAESDDDGDDIAGWTATMCAVYGVCLKSI